MTRPASVFIPPGLLRQLLIVGPCVTFREVPGLVARLPQWVGGCAVWTTLEWDDPWTGQFGGSCDASPEGLRDFLYYARRTAILGCSLEAEEAGLCRPRGGPGVLAIFRQIEALIGQGQYGEARAHFMAWETPRPVRLCPRMELAGARLQARARVHEFIERQARAALVELGRLHRPAQRVTEETAI